MYQQKLITREKKNNWQNLFVPVRTALARTFTSYILS